MITSPQCLPSTDPTRTQYPRVLTWRTIARMLGLQGLFSISIRAPWGTRYSVRVTLVWECRAMGIACGGGGGGSVGMASLSVFALLYYNYYPHNNTSAHNGAACLGNGMSFPAGMGCVCSSPQLIRYGSINCSLAN